MAKKRDFTSNRSGGYQWLLLEIPSSPEMVTEFSDIQGLAEMINDNKERYYDLYDQLYKEYWKLIEDELTERQKEVIKLCAQGKTQIEIAKILNVNQSSVTKSLNGNVDYRNGKRVYGGAKKKLRKLAKNNPKIFQILQEIAELEENSL